MPKTQEEKSPILSRYSELPEKYDPKNPWGSDLVFERQELAASFTSLFRSSRKPFVLAVNGGWGSGKSLFLRMWHDQLQKENQPCFIFNAWEHDHAGTPINAFFTAIRRQSESKEPILAATPRKLFHAFCEKFPLILGKRVSWQLLP